MFKLAHDHKHAYLNTVQLHIVDWAKKANLSGMKLGDVVSTPTECGFPHKLRMQNEHGGVASWVEVQPRRLSLVVEARIRVGQDLMRLEDETKILRHANAMLTNCPNHTKPDEVEFVCYLLYGEAKNGHDATNHVKTSVKTPLFKHEHACLVKKGDSTHQAFFIDARGTHVSKLKAVLKKGKIVFEEFSFVDEFKTSNVLPGRCFSWKLCIRATHPVLSGMMNFCVLSREFFSGKRVRPMSCK